MRLKYFIGDKKTKTQTDPGYLKHIVDEPCESLHLFFGLLKERLQTVRRKGGFSL